MTATWAWEQVLRSLIKSRSPGNLPIPPLLYLYPMSSKHLLLFLLLFVAKLSYSQSFPDSWTDGKYITVNGARLWLVTVGKGEPMILIAGGPGGTHLGL